jgi:multidrug efflux pump subunit AcrB
VPWCNWGQLADVERTTGPSNLRRVDRRRTATLVADPPPDMSLEDALTVMREQVVPPVRAMLPSDASILYDGSADSLAGAVSTMVKNFGLALLILFLLMSALFRSPGDAMLVMLALPLATVGGVLALEVLNLVTFQPLDLLTMIGFIILLGLVVNNAILIVEQARVAEREGLEPRCGGRTRTAPASAPDLLEHPDLAGRHAAAGAQSRCRLGDLPRPLAR